MILTELLSAPMVITAQSYGYRGNVYKVKNRSERRGEPVFGTPNYADFHFDNGILYQSSWQLNASTYIENHYITEMESGRWTRHTCFRNGQPFFAVSRVYEPQKLTEERQQAGNTSTTVYQWDEQNRMVSKEKFVDGQKTAFIHRTFEGDRLVRENEQMDGDDFAYAKIYEYPDAHTVIQNLYNGETMEERTTQKYQGGLLVEEVYEAFAQELHSRQVFSYNKQGWMTGKMVYEQGVCRENHVMEYNDRGHKTLYHEEHDSPTFYRYTYDEQGNILQKAVWLGEDLSTVYSTAYFYL